MAGGPTRDGEQEALAALALALDGRRGEALRALAARPSGPGLDAPVPGVGALLHAPVRGGRAVRGPARGADVRLCLVAALGLLVSATSALCQWGALCLRERAEVTAPAEARAGAPEDEQA